MRKTAIVLFLFTILVSSIAQENSFEPVIIDFFYNAGCSECIKVRTEVLPKLEATYTGLYKLNEYDLGNVTNLSVLVKYQERLDFDKSAFVYLVVDYSEVICGSAEAKNRLLPIVEEKILERYNAGWGGIEPIDISYDKDSAIKEGKKRLKGFTLGMIIIAGLVDGINPCAMVTIVFFLTFLTAHRVSKKRMLLTGLSFCLSCFVVYTLIGVGVFRILLELREKYLIKEIVEWVFVGGLICLSVLSLIDAVRLKSGNKNLIIRLPAFMSGITHKIIRKGFSTRSAIIYGAIIGFVVTLIETACTGQTYLPTIQLLVELETRPFKSFAFLVIYNLMFVLPLVILLGIVLRGISTYNLTAYMKKHAVFAKVIMAIFFAAIAFFLLRF